MDALNHYVDRMLRNNVLPPPAHAALVSFMAEFGLGPEIVTQAIEMRLPLTEEEARDVPALTGKPLSSAAPAPSSR